MNAAPFVIYPVAHIVTALESNMMIKQIKTFGVSEDGAVTVDWVVLTAAVVGLAIASFASIQRGSQSVGQKVGDYLTDTPVEEVMGLDG